MRCPKTAKLLITKHLPPAGKARLVPTIIKNHKLNRLIGFFYRLKNTTIKMRIICLTQVYKVIMCINTSQYQAISSPSKIDQWCKPKPAAKLVLTLVRRGPLMLKERAVGSMKFFLKFSQKYHLSRYHTPPLSPSILEGGIDTQLFNYSHRYNRNLSF